jgi:hypothetical protein
MPLKLLCEHCHEPIGHQDVVFCSSCMTNHNGLALDTRNENKSLKGANEVLQHKLKVALHEIGDLKRQRDETLAMCRERDVVIRALRDKYEPVSEITKGAV